MNPTATGGPGLPEPPAPPKSLRIVSLLPAATEIAAALGLEPHLVGRSHECDWPESVAALPALTAARIDARLPSRGIHEQVGRGLAASSPAGSPATCATPAPGGPSTANQSAAATPGGAGALAAAGPPGLFSLDGGRLASLEPDVILTQAACDVCAVSVADVEAAVQRAGVNTSIVSLAPESLADLWENILGVGAATGRLQKARELVARLRARVASVACRTKSFSDRPSVAIIEWLDPPMAAGNWVPEMVRLAGGIDVCGRAGSHSHWISWDEVVAADPEIVILCPCGFTLDRVLAEAGSEAVRPQLLRLRAVREGRCFCGDGHHLFNRPGPRLVDSLEVLAEILHPGRFRFDATRRFAKRWEA